MIKNWILALRPKTLTAAIVPILVASSFSYYKGSFEMWISALAFLVAVFLQIATNLFNDAIDFKKGADAKRQGPVRITQSGGASYSRVIKVGVTFLGLAILAGAPLVWLGGIDILILGILSLLFTYVYTGGPYPLAYLGIADIFVVLFFGVVAVSGLCFLQLGFWSADSVALGLQVGFLCNLMLVINNLRDMETDKAVGKNTLVVRLGEAFGRSEVLMLYFIPFSFSWFWFGLGMNFTAFSVYVLFPFAIGICFWFLKTPLTRVNKFLGISSIYYLGFGVLLALGMVVDRV